MKTLVTLHGLREQTQAPLIKYSALFLSAFFPQNLGKDARQCVGLMTTSQLQTIFFSISCPHAFLGVKTHLFWPLQWHENKGWSTAYLCFVHCGKSQDPNGPPACGSGITLLWLQWSGGGIRMILPYFTEILEKV